MYPEPNNTFDFFLHYPTHSLNLPSMPRLDIRLLLSASVAGTESDSQANSQLASADQNPVLPSTYIVVFLIPTSDFRPQRTCAKTDACGRFSLLL